MEPQKIDYFFKNSTMVIHNNTNFPLSKSEKKDLETLFKELCRRTFRALGPIEIEIIVTCFGMSPEMKIINVLLHLPQDAMRTVFTRSTGFTVFDGLILLLEEWNQSSRVLIKLIKSIKASYLEELEEIENELSQQEKNKESSLPRTFNIDQLMKEMRDNPYKK
jgi:hypothetical protein